MLRKAQFKAIKPPNLPQIGVARAKVGRADDTLIV